MRGDSSHDGKAPDRVTPLDARRNKRTDRMEADDIRDEGSPGELLIHMRKVREAVPVNTRLREELRARLARTRAEQPGAGDVPVGGAAAAVAAAGQGAGAQSLPFRQEDGRGWPKFWWLFPAALLLATVCWLWWSAAAPKSLEAGPLGEISRFWLEDGPLDFACAPGGRGFIAARGGALLLLDRYGNQTGTVRPPAGQSYAAPAISRSGDKLALVRQHGAGGGEIITAAMPAIPLEPGAAPRVEEALAGAETLLAVEEGKSPTGLTWSPDGQTLAYSLGTPGRGKEVYLLAKGREPVSLGAGRNPAWSPDGSRLVAERTGASGQPELWLVTPGDGSAARLLEGRRPAWSPRGYLAFVRVTNTERVLTYSPDGAPLFTVRQPQGEIRAINLGRKGELPPGRAEGKPLPSDRLLLAPDTTPGGNELNWLRRLEMEGVREPRTLLLEQSNDYQNVNFSPEGDTLLVARRDGGTVALAQAGLREKTTRRGEQ